jgi:CO dehydrogenase/acetyl-CoA synthase alpha subunit
LLARNDEAKKIGENIQICTKQPRNLQRIAGGLKTKTQKIPEPGAGCSKCGRCKVSCPILNETDSFVSSNTGKKYRIRQKVSCLSDWVIYLATCKRCNGQYVGKSKTVFKIRHSNHKQEIKNRIGGLGHHYGGSGTCSYQDLSITIIEQVEFKTFEYLAERELYWQHQIRAYVQNGGNAHCYRKDMKKK